MTEESVPIGSTVVVYPPKRSGVLVIHRINVHGATGGIKTESMEETTCVLFLALLPGKRCGAGSVRTMTEPEEDGPGPKHTPPEDVRSQARPLSLTGRF